MGVNIDTLAFASLMGSTGMVIVQQPCGCLGSPVGRQLQVSRVVSACEPGRRSACVFWVARLFRFIMIRNAIVHLVIVEYAIDRGNGRSMKP